MLQIRLLGGLELLGADGRRPPLPTRSSRLLLAYLALNTGRLFHRDVLAGTLWGERPDRAARNILRNSLWRVRCALKEAGGDGDAVRVEGPELGLLGGIRVDTDEFTALAAAAGSADGSMLGPDQARAIERAAALYRGDLLEGFYDAWTVAPRESLRLAFLTVLERLFAYYRHTGDFFTAIGRGRELVRHDPLRERVHRELMLCHVAMGDRPLAVRQYQTCERVLREELDIEPMEETRELLARIRRGAVPVPAAAPPPPYPDRAKRSPSALGTRPGPHRPPPVD